MGDALLITLVSIFLFSVLAIFIKKSVEREMQERSKMNACLVEFDFEGRARFVVISDDEKGLSIYVNDQLFVSYPGDTDLKIHMDSLDDFSGSLGRVAIWKRYLKTPLEMFDIKPEHKSEDYIT